MGSPFGEDNGTTGGYGSGGEQQGSNPAWNEFLEAVPQEFHEKVTPILQKWDTGVNERFNKVHSEYEPWQQVVKSGVDPETTQFAINLLSQMNDNPKMVYDAMRDYYKFDAQQSAQGNNSGQGQNEPIQEDPYANRFSAIEEQNRVMADILLRQRETELNAQADNELDREMSQLAQKYGKFDERYVLAMMQNGYSGEQSVQQFQSFQQEAVKNYAPKPLIMGSGGGIPGQQINPTKMSDKATKDLVTQMLEAAAYERRQ